MRQAAMICWSACVLALLAGGILKAADVSDTYSGKVVSTSRVQLIIEKQDGTQESFVVNGDTKVKLDGESAAVQDLRMGYLVKVDAKNVGDQLFAEAIDAMKVDAKPTN